MKKALLIGILSGFLLSPQLFAQSKTELISIEGAQIRTKSSGLEERKPFQPIVILEAGNGESLDIWNAVFDQLADFSPVLSYDRIGLGKSEATGEMVTIDSRVKNLEALLKEMKIQPPYILAGNNWGNLLIREFAENHPSDVEGMIYIDPILDSQNPNQLSAYISEKGLDGEQLTSEYMDYQKMIITGRAAGNKQEAEMFLAMLNDNKVIWSSQAVPDVSSLVILGNKFTIFPMKGSLSANSGEFFKLLIESKMDFLDEYTVIHPEYSVLLSSGNMNVLLLQEPTQIAQSFRQVLYADPNKKIANAAHSLSPEEFETFISDLYSYIPGSLLSEENINMMGYSLMRFDKYKQALTLFQKNLANYPNSANVYDSMGEGLMALGRVEEAVPLFKKAVEMGAEPQHRDYELFKKNLIKGQEMLAGKDK